MEKEKEKEKKTHTHRRTPDNWRIVIVFNRQSSSVVLRLKSANISQVFREVCRSLRSVCSAVLGRTTAESFPPFQLITSFWWHQKWPSLLLRKLNKAFSEKRREKERERERERERRGSFESWLEPSRFLIFGEKNGILVSRFSQRLSLSSWLCIYLCVLSFEILVISLNF